MKLIAYNLIPFKRGFNYNRRQFFTEKNILNNVQYVHALYRYCTYSIIDYDLSFDFSTVLILYPRKVSAWAWIHFTNYNCQQIFLARFQNKEFLKPNEVSNNLCELL